MLLFKASLARKRSIEKESIHIPCLVILRCGSFTKFVENRGSVRPCIVNSEACLIGSFSFVILTGSLSSKFTIAR
jgi:hypothetical protein